MTPEKRAATIARARVVADGIVRYRVAFDIVDAERRAEWHAIGCPFPWTPVSCGAIAEEAMRRSGFHDMHEATRKHVDWGNFAELIAILTDREEPTEDDQT